MDAAQLLQIRADLEADRDDLTETLADFRPQAQDPLQEMLAASLAEVTAALNKLETGMYGSCELCGREIGALRLSSLPASRLCLDCEGVPTDDGSV